MSSKMRQVKVIVEGREYIVEVGDLSARPVIARVNQQTYRVQVGDAAAAPAPAPVPAAAAPAVKAEPKPAATPATAKAAAPVGGSKTITAPLPGDIVEIFVKAGDEVTVDQPLCVLEAMKMKNQIRSTRGGRIATVHVAPGEAVAFGAALFSFE